jgi:hypothetical protein
LEVKSVLWLEKGTQTKESMIGRLDFADTFVQMKAIECKIKGII